MLKRTIFKDFCTKIRHHLYEKDQFADTKYYYFQEMGYKVKHMRKKPYFEVIFF